jgi:cysteine-rich repeat protein
VEDTTNDPSCVPAVCGNDILEEGEDCDDGNTAAGDCCAADCTFEASGSACDDGTFCTADDACDGAGECLGGGDTDCDDSDICTDDSCDEDAGTCVNTFDETNDPVCDSVRAEISANASCGFGLGETEVCFDFQNAATDELPGGADDVTAIDWCVTWDADAVNFDCTDDDQDGVPDDLAFFVDPGFSTLVQCTPEDPVCRLRISIIDKAVPFDLLPDDTLACATFSVLPGVTTGDSPVPIGAASASDTLGSSVPLETHDDSIALDGCCLADCNGDDLVDIADAVSVILELSDTDGNDFCEVDNVVPFDGSPCCDCNGDSKIDIADAVCIVNGLGELQCPATAVAAATTLAETWELPQSEVDLDGAKVASRTTGTYKPGLTLVQQQIGWTVVVPVIFEQFPDDLRPGGRDEITAFSACIDFDQTVLNLDTTDADLDGIPDAIDLRLPAGHVAFAKVDPSRSACELHLGILDLTKPSRALPDGAVAEIEFQMLSRSAGRGIWVLPGVPDTLSFGDVLGVSQPVGARTISRSATID